MAIPVTVTPYYKGSTTYYRYSTPYVGKRFASGSFAAERGMTPAQARERAVQTSARYLNLPLYEFEGYEQTAPSPAIVGQATYAAEQQAEENRAITEALHERREALKSGFAGEFKTEYLQRLAVADIGTNVPTQQEFMKIQQLKTGEAVFRSAEEFQQVAGKLSKFGDFAGVSEFKAQIIPPPPKYIPPPEYVPPYIPQDQRPFAGYKRPEQPIKAPYEGFVLSPLYQKLSGVSRAAHGSIESILGYSEKAHPVIKVGAGFAGVFTGLPEYFGGAALGAEYSLRNQPKSQLSRVSPLFEAVPGAMKTGSEIAEQIRTKPFESIGMGLGLVATGKGGKISSSIKTGFTQPKIIAFVKSETASISLIKRSKPTMQILEAPKEISAIIKPEIAKAIPVVDLSKVGIIMKPNFDIPKARPKTSAAGAYVTIETAEIRTGLKTSVRPVEGAYKTPNLLAQYKQKLKPVMKTSQEVTPKSIYVPVQRSIIGLKSLAIPALASVSMAKARTLQTPIAIQTPVSIQRQVSLQRPVAIQKSKSLAITKLSPINIQISKQIATQISKPALVKMQPARRVVLKYRPPSIPRTQRINIIRKPVKMQKTQASDLLTKTGRRKGFGKFGELAKIATPKQIIRGLK